MSFGNNIKNFRIKNNMTQKELAEKLNLSRPTIGRYETDERFPDKDVIIQLADIFKISLDTLFGRQSENNLLLKGKDESYFPENFKKAIIKYNIPKEYFEDDEFVKDLLNFGADAALKIKSLK